MLLFKIYCGLSADTLVSNALKLFIYYLFDQQTRLCMFCHFHLEKDVFDLKNFYKNLCVILFYYQIDGLKNIMELQQETCPYIFYYNPLVLHLYLLMQCVQDSVIILLSIIKESTVKSTIFVCQRCVLVFQSHLHKIIVYALYSTSSISIFCNVSISLLI